MPSRMELEGRARVVGITPSNYPNDSRLEQRVIYNENTQATVTGTVASTTLSSTGTAPSNGDTITLGAKTYTFVTTLTEVAASCVLTGTNAANATNGSTVTIGTVTYIFMTTLGSAQNQVHIGTTADNTLTNLSNAITGGGTIGTDYSTGTVTNTQVTAGSVTSHAITITSLTVGTFSNSITVGTTEATYSWATATLTGGVNPVANQIVINATIATMQANTKAAINGASGAGTTYSSGTVANLLGTAGTVSGNNLPVTAPASASGFTVATTATGSQYSWTGTTMANNVQAIIVMPTADAAGETGGALV